MLPCLSYERQQALVQEQLARLAQRERETASTGLDELAPALIMEKEKAYKEQEKANVLVSDELCLLLLFIIGSDELYVIGPNTVSPKADDLMS